MKDAEFVGLCHYRRYFGCEITQENICQWTFEEALADWFEDNNKLCLE